MLFGSFMACGAVYSWAYLPDIQRVIGQGHHGAAELGRVGGAGGPGGGLGGVGIGIGGVDPGRSREASAGDGHGVHGYRRRYGRRRNDTFLETKNLEDLGEGRAKAHHEGEIITIRDKWTELKRLRGRRRRLSSSAGA